MIRLSQVRGRRVLARENARLLGSVRRILLDPAEVTVSAAELEGVVEEANILPWRAVVSVGPDALMVERADVLEQPSQPVKEAIERGIHDLQGKQVLTDLGDSLGQLEDIEFEQQSGRVTHLRVPGHSLPLARFVSIGPETVIVPAPR